MKFSINSIPEFSKKKRIVVVGIIGKSPYQYPNKTSPILSEVSSDNNGIECHWDERRNVLYLHAVTYLDTRRLVEFTANLDESSKSIEKDADASHWLVAAGELAIESCKIIGLLFQLCHIIVLSSPTPVFDIGYLQLFKAIDAFRIELQPQVAAVLSQINAEGAWKSHGRTCCPRLLFHFKRAPRALRPYPASLKRLEHSVEDQLYFIFRKARIITNVCAKSLFAIPKNEEFVYMSFDEPGSARDLSSLVRGLVQLCTGEETPSPPTSDRLTFKQFLQGHIDLAFGEGFDDNVGKYAMSTSFFELPSAMSWRAAAQALSSLYLGSEVSHSAGTSDGAGGADSALFESLATEVRFSKARCAKVLPIAQASYSEGLPGYYASQHHAHKVSVALGVLDTHARGPLAAAARDRLRTACTVLWRNRNLCEAPSLTHYPCVHPEHDNTKEHSSNMRYVSACACGRTKCTREDPYTVRQANYTFYQLAAEECGHCHDLQQIEFPVFQPSTSTYKAASVKDASSQEGVDACIQTHNSPTPSVEDDVEGAWSAPDALSPGSVGDEEEDEEKLISPEEEYQLVRVKGDTASEKVISRQPSTTEYLPGMLHTASPLGLLPAYSSWSLVCVGPSSLYSHSVGLPEHLQPGFLPHTNFLLPVDTAVRTDQVGTWRTVSSRGRGKGAAHLQLTVKIFIGFEYECPRGHRFMMSTPETVVNGGGSGARDASAAGARLVAHDMPVYAPCLCRNSATLAQLTRLHVVTPKAPVLVTLHPQVQPVSGGPIFIPQPLDSPVIKLTASAYWILRLPYVYCSERGIIPRPKANFPLQQPGKIISPVYGLTD